MNGRLEELKNRLLIEKANRKQNEEELIKCKEEKEKADERYTSAKKALKISQIVAESIQNKVRFQINYLVTTALAEVFPEPWEFELRFVERRNKTEADLVFKKFGYETNDILSAGGGGVADIVAKIALPLAIWSIKKTRNCLILDEPTKNLHDPLYQENASAMIKEISNELGIQIIIITDQKHLITSGDKIFEVTQENKISKITEL